MYVNDLYEKIILCIDCIGYQVFRQMIMHQYDKYRRIKMHWRCRSKNHDTAFAYQWLFLCFSMHAINELWDKIIETEVMSYYFIFWFKFIIFLLNNWITFGLNFLIVYFIGYIKRLINQISWKNSLVTISLHYQSIKHI